jgi:hypothetical protein
LPGKPFWLTSRHNWTTCIVGGLGIAGMALGNDHPDSDRLIEIAQPVMDDCLRVYGPEGEFNESVGYAGAIQLLVNYYAALRYHAGEDHNQIAAWPIPEACRWVMHFTNPPGHIVPFGDAHRRTAVTVQYFAAVAAATRDPILQWFFATYHSGEQQLRHDVRAFLFYDATLQPQPPESYLPLGRAYHGYGQCISSRTDWNPATTACVVTSKAGREVNHAHYDNGQVCIDGHGEPLIVDLGSCLYPTEDFYDRLHKFYNYSGFGHNIPMIGGRELRLASDTQGRIVDSAFDNESGAWWILDTTPAYQDARSIIRLVIHFFPGIVAVLDRIELDSPESVTLRWHTVDRCTPDADGCFLVAADRAKLASRVRLIEGDQVTFRRGHHVYKAPYDRNRLGELQIQKNESFIETTTSGQTVCLLSLFSVIGPDEKSSPWQEAKSDGWTIETPQGTVRVDAINQQLSVKNLNTGASLMTKRFTP